MITTAIFSIDNREDLTKLGKALNLRFKQLQEMDVLEYDVGDKVSFDDREGNTVNGVITKMNRKTINVLQDNGVRWRIAPSHLTKE